MYVGVNRFRKVLISGGLAGLAALSVAQSDLGTIYSADYIGAESSHISGNNISMTWGAHDNIAAGSITAGAYGFMKWKDNKVSGSGNYGLPGNGANGLGLGTSTSFYTLCGQFKYLNDPSKFDVYDITPPPVGQALLGSPLPSYRADTLYRGASVLSFDFDGAGDTYSDSAFEHAFKKNTNIYGAAIQLAVWAAIYGDGSYWDTTNLSGNTLTIGTFVATDSNANFVTAGFGSGIVATARAYYNTARAGGTWNMGPNVSTYWLDAIGTTSHPGQDQFTIDPSRPPQSVPEPFTMALMGGSAIAGYIRMKKRRAA